MVPGDTAVRRQTKGILQIDVMAREDFPAILEEAAARLQAEAKQLREAAK